jgi:hypothetical protein
MKATQQLKTCSALSHYKRHKQEHMCAGSACPERVRLWRDYEAASAVREPAPGELAQVRLAYSAQS